MAGRLSMLALLLFGAAALPAGTATAPAPIDPVPTPQHVAWQRMEVNAFVHFGPNAFTGAEWGSGRESPAIFNPTAIDARQWVRAFKAAGMKGVVITAKHHDGFCLWPSKYSAHTVARSSWRDGRGDVLRELSDACRAEGLQFGVYLSPWDRNHPTYGTSDYNRVFANMLEEVLTSYGPVFEVWFDGANGEGPNGRRQVYDWELFQSTVKRLQPQALVFSDAGPGVRWVGNERGEAPLTVWSMIDASRYAPGTALSHELGEGFRQGRDWVPPECDVSIRPGWFYRASEDAHVKSPQTLFRIYEQSVGRNCTLLLNVPPDHRGLIAEADVKALAGFHRLVEGTYGRNLISGATATATLTRGPAFDAANVLDGNADTYWAAPDSATEASLTVSLRQATRFNRVVLQEHIALGQRVGGFTVDALVDGAWRRIGYGTTIGNKRILSVPETTATAVRISVLDARACPTLSEIGLFAT